MQEEGWPRAANRKSKEGTPDLRRGDVLEGDGRERSCKEGTDVQPQTPERNRKPGKAAAMCIPAKDGDDEAPKAEQAKDCSPTKKKTRTPTAYREPPAGTEFWLEPDGLALLALYAREGLGADRTAARMGITPVALQRLRRQHPAIEAALLNTAELEQAKVELALLDTALKGGVQAQQFWLKNRCPARWRDRVPDEDGLRALLMRLDHLLVRTRTAALERARASDLNTREEAGQPQGGVSAFNGAKGETGRRERADDPEACGAK